MRKMRFMALMLSLTMLCTQMPQVAFAAETGEESAMMATVDEAAGDVQTENVLNEEEINNESETPTVYEDGFSVTSEGVLQYKGTSMPTAITAENFHGATIIPVDLFTGKAIKSIVIPKTVTTIEAKAFYNCASLESVIFETGSPITSLASQTFSGCSKLNHSTTDGYITIPSGVTTIGERCFEDCSSLYGIVFDDALVTIGDSAFGGCSKLKYFENFENTKLTEISDKLFEATAVDDELKLPATVKKICTNAFKNCASIGKLDISNLDGSALVLQTGCFSESGITGVTFPKNFTTLTAGAFDNCNSLTELTIGNSDGTGITTIKAGAITNCKNLKTVKINKSVETIENNAFENCDKITAIKIYHDEEASGTKLNLYVDSLPANKNLTVYGYDDTVEEWVGNHTEEGVKFKTLHTGMSVKINDQYNGNLVSFSATRNNDAGVAEALTDLSSINVGDVITVTDKPATNYALISMTHGPKATGFMGESMIFTVSTADLDENGKIAIDAAFTNLATDDMTFSFVDSEENALTVIGDNTQALSFDSSSLKKQVYIKAKPTSKSSYKTVYSNPWLWNFISTDPSKVTVSSSGVITALAATDTNNPVIIKATLKADNTVIIKLSVTVNSTRDFDHVDGVTFGTSNHFSTDKTENGMAVAETSVGYIKTAVKNGTTGNLEVSVNAYATEKDSEGKTTNYPINSSFKWTTSNSSVVRLMYEKTSSNNNTIKVCGIGQAVITATSTIKTTEKVSFIVRVVDKTPVVEESAIYVNTKATSGSGIFTLIQSYGGTVSADSYLKIVSKTGDDEWKDCSSDFKIKKSGEAKERTDGGTEQDMEFVVNDTSKYKSTEATLTNLYAKLLIDGEKYYYVALPKVVITSSLPQPTIKVEGKINTFYTAASSITNQATVTITSPSATSFAEMPTLVNEKDSDTSFTNNFKLSLPENAKSGDYSKLVITQNATKLKTDDNGKIVNTGYLSIKYKGYDAVKIKITVPTSVVTPKITLAKTNYSVHKLAANQYIDIPVYETVKKTKSQISLSNVTVKYLYGDNGTDSYFDDTAPSKAKDKDGNDVIRISLPTEIYSPVKAVLQVSNTEWSQPLTYTIKIGTTSAKPVLKLSESVIAINKSSATENYATFQCTSDFCDNDTLTVGTFTQADKALKKKVQGSKIAISYADGKITARVNSSDLPANGVYTYTTTCKINYAGSDNYYEKNLTIKVKVYEAVPAVVLKKTAVTLNNYLVGVTSDGLVAENTAINYSFKNMPRTAADNVAFTAITNTTGRKANWINYTNISDAPVAVSFASGVMNVYLKQALTGSQKFTLSGVTIDGQKANDIVFTVKTIDKQPTITVKSKANINVLDSSSKAEYTVTIKNFAGTVDASKLVIMSEDENASATSTFDSVDETTSHFKLTDANGAKVSLMVNETNRSSLNSRRYRMKVRYIFGSKNGNTKASESTILAATPKQTLPGVAVSNSSLTLYSGNTAVATSTVVKAQEKKDVVTPTISSIGWASNATTECKDGFTDPATLSADNAYTYFDKTTGKLTIKIKNAALLKRGTTYTLNLVAYFDNQMSGSKGTAFTVKVTVK